TGGFNNGSDTVRIIDLCDTCEWKEYPGALANGRWYATQVTLGDGKFMVFGGRDFPTYEFVPPEGKKNTHQDVVDFNFLVETHDPVENNLYPFVYLSTDGNIFIFANNRSVILNPNTRKIIHEFPVLPNGARNYPASGSACLLPIILKPNEDRSVIPAEILICGGAPHDAFAKADLQRPKVFLPGSCDCARLDFTKRDSKWNIFNMPSARLLGDMAVLPTGDVLIVNGAKTGSAGWDDAREPNLNPVLYKFQTDGTSPKFTVLNPSNIPRMYHSSFAVLPDAKVLIAGSNTNPGYLDDALFPTEVRPNEDRRVIPAEILICGGAPHDAFAKADLQRPKVFLPGSSDCARLDFTKRNSKWKILNMPSARLLGDMAVLPTGDVLIVNGAKTGSAGWDDAREPNLNPVLYKFKTDGTGSKFTVLNPSNIARMYHSSFAVLPDAKVLIAGSNTNPGYLDDALFPTEVRVEKFSPPYLDPNLAMFRQEIITEKSDNQLKYGQKFTVQIRGNSVIDQQKLQVTIYSPPFVTHGICMNQRLIQLGILEFNKDVAPNTNNIVLQAPMNGNIAQPGYYMLFVNYNGVPCLRSM
ncbi:hypothetical protein Godav_025558, partial [Gossypium davidsonii]|nr:hypothetical protein [Gossypium davidsonii]